ncbi:hypothetical protein C8Q74DRAFT_1283430 [Fomes fomentarius]|nr:hypothetical protein C8Q74DRAFT_1283430 [Fomes fomentarius]
MLQFGVPDDAWQSSDGRPPVDAGILLGIGHPDRVHLMLRCIYPRDVEIETDMSRHVLRVVLFEEVERFSIALDVMLLLRVVMHKPFVLKGWYVFDSVRDNAYKLFILCICKCSSLHTGHHRVSLSRTELAMRKALNGSQVKSEWM